MLLQNKCLAEAPQVSASALSVPSGDPAVKWLLLDACQVQGKRLVAVGERGAIILSEDKGRTWSRARSESKSFLTSLSFAADGLHGWAAGHDATLLATEDGGASWKVCHKGSDPEQAFLSICALSDSHILAVGAFGHALQSTDAGKSWSPLSIPSNDRHLNHLAKIGSQSLLLCGESGLVLRSTDAGQSWSEIKLPYEGSFFRSLLLADGSLLVHGLRGHIFRAPSAQADATDWSEINSPAAALLAGSVQLRDQALVLAGQARVFLVSKDKGLSFQVFAPGLTTPVSCLLQADDGTLLAFGEAGVSIISLP